MHVRVCARCWFCVCVVYSCSVLRCVRVFACLRVSLVFVRMRVCVFVCLCVSVLVCLCVLFVIEFCFWFCVLECLSLAWLSILCVSFVLCYLCVCVRLFLF